MIRHFTQEDLSTLFNLYVKMEQEFPWCKPDLEVFENTWTNLFPEEIRTGYVSQDENGKIDGFILGFLFRHVNAGTLLAIESIWYVDPAKRDTGIGRKLLAEFEEWAKSKGAVQVMIGKPFRKIRLHGNMKGYNSLETVLMKEL